MRASPALLDPSLSSSYINSLMGLPHSEGGRSLVPLALDLGVEADAVDVHDRLGRDDKSGEVAAVEKRCNLGQDLGWQLHERGPVPGGPPVTRLGGRGP